MQRCSQLMTVVFQTPGHSSVTQNLTIIKKSQLVTITSAMLNERKQSLCDSLLNYNCSIKLSSYLKEVN